MEQDELEYQKFMKNILHRRLLYLWELRYLSYPVDDKEIADLETVIYPNIKVPEIEIQILYQRDVDELQLLLSFADKQSKIILENIKAQVFRLGKTSLRIYQEHRHPLPHFHIQYKREFDASYSIDTLERLAGDVPDTYAKPILYWASNHQAILRNTWKMLQAGEDIHDLFLEAPEAK